MLNFLLGPLLLNPKNQGQCILTKIDIADWMKCNRLQLNSSKSEFIWCSSSRRLKHLDCNPFVIGADAVLPKNEVRYLYLVLERNCQ